MELKCYIFEDIENPNIKQELYLTDKEFVAINKCYKCDSCCVKSKCCTLLYDPEFYNIYEKVENKVEKLFNDRMDSDILMG